MSYNKLSIEYWQGKDRHGRSAGGNGRTSKLTVEQVLVIKARLASGETVAGIARDMKEQVSESTIRHIKLGHTWNDIR